MTTTEQRFSNRTLALVYAQQVAAVESETKREIDTDQDFLQFVREELEGMQQKVGELRFAIAALTTLVKSKLDHG